MQVKRHAPTITLWHKGYAAALASIVGLSLIWIVHHYLASANILDEASKELIAYDTLAAQKDQQTSALYHLAIASNRLKGISSNTSSLPSIERLKTKLKIDTEQHISAEFLPSVLGDIEKTIADNQLSQVDRYQALKIYLMLSMPQRFSQTEVNTWFKQHWQKNTSQSDLRNKLALLKRALQQSKQSITLNQQVVSDARNYLNALPATYLYYSLAKKSFSQEKQAINLNGFSFANHELPVYLTKAGFKQVLANLNTTTATLQADNWVLARQDLGNLQTLLQQAYCYEYVTWWQSFMRHVKPEHVQNYAQARQLAQSLRESDAFSKLIDIIQQQTAPEAGDNAALFNQEIASKFTELSFISHSAVQNLTLSLQELERFLTTLSIVNDQGRTAFALTKARFQGDTLNNPLSALYSYAQQLPEPVSSWAKQIADDTWFSLISDSRTYINKQWQETVLPNYQESIANRYPFDTSGAQEIAIADFDHFFANHGVLNQFIESYLKPFLDTSQAQWQLKEANNYVLPISSDVLNELIRANIITNMFFPNQSNASNIEFSLQKVSLDPIVGSLRLSIGEKSLVDTQSSDSFTQFSWPQPNAKLVLNSIEGNHYELDEEGPWAFFKMLQKVNVLVDEQDSASLQILFEVNGNSGRYLLKTQNEINPFTPGILNGFVLPELIV